MAKNMDGKKVNRAGAKPGKVVEGAAKAANQAAEDAAQGGTEVNLAEIEANLAETGEDLAGSEANLAENQALVEMHKKARTRKKRRIILTIVIVVAAVLVVGAFGVRFLRNKVTASVADTGAEVISAEVTTGSIRTTVSGSGTLADEDVQDVTMPSSLVIDEYNVETGDSVEEGDIIATVTADSLEVALSDTQAALDALDDEIEDAEDDAVDGKITAGVSGRVKYIAVETGDAVAEAMYENGALMYLSLDGYMAVDIESDSLSAGDAVTVTTSDGTAYDGEVESNTHGTAVVLVTDDGPEYQDSVTVTSSDGGSLGSGELYIHSQLAITGYAGTVSSINVSLNEKVSSGTNLITLTDTETTANYDALLEEREDMEEQMQTLIGIYNEGGVAATASGTVSSVTTGSDSTDTSSDTTIATISLDEKMVVEISVDETDILSLTEGQDATVTVDSLGDDAYQGEVTSIDTTATSASGVTSYTAQITIDKVEGMLSGMSASVVIIIEGVDDALIIPVDALHETSSTAYVYTEYDEENEEFGGMVEVTTGLTGSDYVEITSGLSEGDTVYYTEDSSSEGFTFPGGMGGDFDMEGGDGFEMPSGSEGGAIGGSDAPTGGTVEMPSGGGGGGDMPSDGGGRGGFGGGQ